MKIAIWLVASLAVFVVLFYAFNYYIYMQEQGDTTMQNTTLEVVPIEHASLVLKWGDTVIFADPVGDASLYAGQPSPDIILVTHEHGDHFSTSTLTALMASATVLIAPQSVFDQLPAALKEHAKVMKNGDVISEEGLSIQAIPAYNIRQEALQYHPKGRDNGYVLEGGDTRVYIAGDTEGIPEMRALKDIDIAFIPMNLPYTMSVEDAADAVLAFKPAKVYPYHYRGMDGLSDVEKFKQLVQASSSAIEVELGNWYPSE
jgi:L-ascorbate metabolism protein UlaG (beta-lactamase superfamily)